MNAFLVWCKQHHTAQALQTTVYRKAAPTLAKTTNKHGQQACGLPTRVLPHQHGYVLGLYWPGHPTYKPVLARAIQQTWPSRLE